MRIFSLRTNPINFTTDLAFINGKHIKGVVKEKEQAHREYKQAISEGHGAYLMDEETPVCSELFSPRM